MTDDEVLAGRRGTLLHAEGRLEGCRDTGDRRVRVAEMRLYQPNELRSGLEKSNLYGALQSAIDAARTQFLQNFLSKSSTMVDYLHLEIMRSLAHDDDRLLGHEYPGPMV